jgi:hypothetical protein
MPLEWATLLGPLPLENVYFVLVPPAMPGLYDPPGMLPLPIKTRLNPRNDFLFAAKRKGTHPLYPNLLFRLGDLNFESLVFFLPHRLQHLAQDRRTDPQI